MIIFVYNAASGRFNALLDSAHKILSPGTYDCKLCELTYGVFGEKVAWKQFREETQQEMRFLHKDEFEREYGVSMQYPVVLHDSHGSLKTILSSQEFGQFQDVQQLIDELRSRLKAEN